MAAGRPTLYREELAENFCSRIASGRAIRDVCTDSDMPSRTTIALWCKNDKEFSNRYNEAKKERGEKIFEEVLNIVDNVEPDSAAVAKARLQMDARKWFLSKMLPSEYGEKINPVEVDEDSGEITINVVRVSKNKDAN